MACGFIVPASAHGRTRAHPPLARVPPPPPLGGLGKPPPRRPLPTAVRARLAFDCEWEDIRGPPWVRDFDLPDDLDLDNPGGGEEEDGLGNLGVPDT